MPVERYPHLFKTYGDWLSVKELAEYLGLSTTKAYNLLQSRKIKARHVGGQWRVPSANVAEFLDKA